jgi:hypothetical protein
VPNKCQERQDQKLRIATKVSNKGGLALRYVNASYSAILVYTRDGGAMWAGFLSTSHVVGTIFGEVQDLG